MSASTGLTADAPVRGHHTPEHLALGTHSVHFYDDDSYFLGSLTTLIATALVEGDSAVIIATQEHRDGLAKRLKGRGLDLEAAVKTGRYCVLDAAETLSKFMVHGAPDPARFSAYMGYFLSSAQPARTEGSPHLFLFGEMVALLSSEGNIEAAIKLEQLWNDLANTYTFDLHCAYSMKNFDNGGHSHAFRSICAEHSHVNPTENYTALASENDRLRSISLLQQRAQTAETETAGRLRAEEALRHSEKLAATGRLAATVAHEINSPLEAISNAIYLARCSSPSTEIAGYLRTADEQLARVAQITKQTLGFYRESAAPGIVRLSAVLDELLILYARKLEAKNLSVKKEYRNEFETWGLEGELRQVFANQLANAIYAMPQNGCLTIRIRKTKRWNNSQKPGTAVSLVDNGSGISRESLTRIFDPFFTTKQDVGNGLGLWITRDIVTRHGGSIRARSNTRPGSSGTIFTTFLPHHKAATPTAA